MEGPIKFLRDIDNNDEEIPLGVAFSPEDNLRKAYPNEILCKFTLPKCPSRFQTEMVLSNNFSLEQPLTTPPFSFCLDHVYSPSRQLRHVINSASSDFSKVLCGKQEINCSYTTNDGQDPVKV